jgi:hypothetical protein
LNTTALEGFKNREGAGNKSESKNCGKEEETVAFAHIFL